MKKLLLILLIAWPLALMAQQNDFYVSFSTGLDSNPGTITQPWKTLARVKAEPSFAPGDSILFMCGDEWFEGEYYLQSSGLEGQEIYYGQYGTGDAPIFNGGAQMNGTWYDSTGNIWRYEFQQAIADQGEDGGYNIIIGNDTIKAIYGSIVDDTASMDQPFEYTRQGSNPHWIYFYALGNPALIYDEIIEDSIGRCFRLNNQNHIKIEGIEFVFFKSFPIREEYNSMVNQLDGLEVAYSKMTFCGMPTSEFSGGISAYRNNMSFHHNYISHAGRRGISINVDPSGTINVWNVNIYNNTFKFGFHTTAIDISSDGNSSFRNFNIYNNIIDDTDYDYSLYREGAEQIYTESKNNGHIRNLKAYNNIHYYTTGACLNLNDVDTGGVYYCSFVGINVTNPSQVKYQLFLTDGSSELDIRNNVYYNDRDNALGNYGTVYKNATSGVDVNIMNYNHYYLTSPTNYIIFDQGGFGTYTQLQFSSYQTDMGFDLNSTAGVNPEFNSIIQPYDVRPSSINSPLVGAGTPIAGITTDRDGNLRSATAPTIGAFEFKSVDSTFKDITVFVAPNQDSSRIDSIAQTVNFYVPFGTDITILAPLFSATDSVTVAGVEQVSGVTENDFTNPVIYRVVALDGSFKDYTVTATINPEPPTPPTRTSPLNVGGAVLRFEGFTLVPAR